MLTAMAEGEGGGGGALRITGTINETSLPQTIVIRVPAEKLHESYVINFAVLAFQRHAETQVEEGVGRGEVEAKELQDEPESEQCPEPVKKKKRRRKDEGEEYDLNDPFIDDAELPLGVSLSELLSTKVNETPEKVSNTTNSTSIITPKMDFYVWKGRLPESESDPLWAEKLEARKRPRRKPIESKTRRRKDNSKLQPENITLPTKKASSFKATSKKKVKENLQKDEKHPKKGKVTKNSLRDCIVAIGEGKEEEEEEEEDNDENEKGGEIIVDRIELGERHPSIDFILESNNGGESHDKGEMIDCEELNNNNNNNDNDNDNDHDNRESRIQSNSTTVLGGGEERMRKRFNISTPFLELEASLAMKAFNEEAMRTAYIDPKRFPSNLRPLCNEVIVTCLRQLERKTTLPATLFEELSQHMPFPLASLEKLVYTKIVPLHCDELFSKVIPGLFTLIKDEVQTLYGTSEGGSETIESTVMTNPPAPAPSAAAAAPQMNTMEGGRKKGIKWTEKLRELVWDLIRQELDAQALDRLCKAYKGNLKVETFSEIGIRKALYPRIVDCWPPGELSTIDLGKEYSIYRRKLELKKLKEHGIEVTPVLVPIAKPKLEERKFELSSPMTDSNDHQPPPKMIDQQNQQSQLSSPTKILPPFNEAFNSPILNPLAKSTFNPPTYSNSPGDKDTSS